MIDLDELARSVLRELAGRVLPIVALVVLVVGVLVALVLLGGSP